MAFPTTGILDPFTGANEDPLTTNWTTSLHSGHNNLRRVSNALQGEGTGAFSSGYYDVASYGPDSECRLTITTLPDENSQIRLLLRLQGLGVDTFDGYQLRYEHVAAGGSEVGIYRMDDTADILLGAHFTVEFANGDDIGFEMIGDTLKGYRKPAAGAWTELLSRTDSTYDSGGFLGVMISEGTVPIVLDDFGGGTVVTGPLYTIVNGSDETLTNVNAGGTDVAAGSYKDGVSLSDAELAVLLDGTSFGHRDIAVFADLSGDAAARRRKEIALTVPLHAESA